MSAELGSIDAEKRRLRVEFGARRRGLAPSLARDAGYACFANLAPILPLRGFVALTLPMRGEIDLATPALETLGDRVALIAMRDDGTLTCTRPSAPRSADEGPLRAPSAAGDTIPGALLAAVLVPGVAFAPDGTRLGRGGGYFDRFLATVTNRALFVGTCYDWQVVESLPRLPHDVGMSHVATDLRLLRVPTPV